MATVIDQAAPPTAASLAPGELDMLAGIGAQLDADTTPADPNAPEPAPAPEVIPTGEVLNMVLAPAFALLAPNWKITDSESRQLADVYGQVLDKWFPDLMSNVGPELAAALVTVAILGPRLGKPRKLEPPKAKPGAIDESQPGA